MGLLRYLLASLVLAGHLGHTVMNGINPGIPAVVVFYMLAGHVVTGLWQKWHQQPGALRRFYTDRLWRILPQYYAACAVAAILWMLGAQSPFLAMQPSVLQWLAQLAVVPLSFYMYTGADSFVLVPPAWSLGVELQFYLIAPFLVLLPLRWLALVMAASLSVFVAAQLQWLHTDHFGYRLLPGVLFLFLCGAWLRRCTHTTASVLALLWCAMALYLVWIWQSPVPVHYRRDVALGFVAGLPALALVQWHRRSAGFRTALLSPLFASTRLKRLDNVLASASYGVFLWHFPVLWALSLVNFPWAQGSLAELSSVALLSTGCALAAHWAIEKPVWKRRRSFATLPNACQAVA